MATRFRKDNGLLLFSLPCGPGISARPDRTGRNARATFGNRRSTMSFSPIMMLPLCQADLPGGLELHLSGAAAVEGGLYSLQGAVRGARVAAILDGGSVCVRSLATGLTDEAFLDAEGNFAQAIEVDRERENRLEIAVCDGFGQERGRVSVCVPPRDSDRPAPALEASAEPGPAWTRFTQLVRHCLELAAKVGDATRRDRTELFEHVYTQERYAEQARDGHDARLYHECFENLEKYAAYLDQLLRDALPRPPRSAVLPPQEEARAALERFRTALAGVWKKVRAQGRADLEGQLKQVAEQAKGLSQRGKTDPGGVLLDVRRLLREVDGVARQIVHDERSS
jgi:hypothetical protein